MKKGEEHFWTQICTDLRGWNKGKIRELGLCRPQGERFALRVKALPVQIRISTRLQLQIHVPAIFMNNAG